MSDDDSFIDFADEENINSHLDRQMEIYTHTQKRAERLIQLLIASFAVVATFGDTGSLSGLINYLGHSGPETTFEILSIFTVEEQQQILNSVGIPISSLILFVAILLILESITWSAEVVIMPKLRPYLGGSDKGILRLRKSDLDEVTPLDYNLSQSDSERLKNDIKYNQAVLSEMDKYLRRSYLALPIAVSVTLLSVVPYLAEVSGDISILVFLSVILFSFITGMILYLLWALIQDVFGENNKDNTPIDFLLDTFVGPSQIGGFHHIYYILIIFTVVLLYIPSALFTLEVVLNLVE